MSDYTESNYLKKDTRKRQAPKEHQASKPRVYQPASPQGITRVKEMLRMTQNPSRSFGRELQGKTNSELKREQERNDKKISFFKPNPNERLWNPSPSKKARSNKEVSDELKEKLKRLNSVRIRPVVPPPLEENTQEPWGDNDSGDKENTTSRYFPTQPKPQLKITPIIPYNEDQPPIISDLNNSLNNSFTEKISNLDIGALNESLTSHSSLPPTPVPVESPVAENERRQTTSVDNWVESLDPDYPYISEILNYWHSLEVNHQVNPTYMDKQREISYKMRTILVDWLVEVVEEYQIGEATLHRCVQFVDRFLSKLQISRSNLQLLGTTCLFIACKVEEIHPPDTGDLVYITDNTYDKPQLLKMECLALSVLDFDLLTPTTHEFTEYFSNTLHLSSTAKECSHYIIELTLLNGECFLKYTGSVIAIAACFVSIHCCGDTHANSSNNPEKKGTLPEVLNRVKRLNTSKQYVELVQQVVSDVYITLFNVSTNQSPNSVCNKYKQFQDQKFSNAVASSAACIPWFNFT